MKHIWQLKFFNNGFEYFIYISGTEEEMRAYANSELGHGEQIYSYSGITDEEYTMIKKLGTKVYLAPELREEKI